MPGGFHPTRDAILAWPKPNYVDPQTKGNELLVVTIISTILSITAVLARVWVRIGYQRQFRADDVMLVLCIVPTVGIAGLLILTETKFRWFRHIWDVPLDEITGRQYVSESLASSRLSHDLWVWTYVETNLLVICSAIPPLRVLFKRLVGNSLSHNASKTPVHNPFHGRKPSNQSSLADTSKNGASTEAIALRGMEPGTSQSLERQAKATGQVDSGAARGHKAQNSQRFSKIYLDKELPPIR
ncbi:hypothetical protein V500_00523 [Pseudogymnoascus sp. VKM F-4518 (FW-2643)]|nr:hypothetical protein V500_00523 [Pseudogymnoascus sp. VKM F-4518 (FW-2643)]